MKNTTTTNAGAATTAQKRSYLSNAKSLVAKSPEWLLASFNSRNGHETTWSVRINRAVLRRAKLI